MAEARYLYCITNRLEKEYGDIGIEKNRVYSIIYKDIAAVVHDCESKPYESKNVEMAKVWVLAHNHVVETVMGDKWTAIPATFDTIIKGEDMLRSWMGLVYQETKNEIQRISGKAEYGVEVYAEQIQKDFGDVNSGAEYLSKRKGENLALEKLKIELADHKSDILEMLKTITPDIQLLNSKMVPDGFKDKIPIIKASCLVDQNRFKKLSILLDDLQKGGFAVRFTGPWPPYSFVNKLEGEGYGAH